MNQHSPFPAACAFLKGHAFEIRAPRAGGGEILAAILASPDARLISFELLSAPALTTEEKAELNLLDFFAAAMTEERALTPLLSDLVAALPEGALSARLLSAALAQHPEGRPAAPRVLVGRAP